MLPSGKAQAVCTPNLGTGAGPRNGVEHLLQNIFQFNSVYKEMNSAAFVVRLLLFSDNTKFHSGQESRGNGLNQEIKVQTTRGEQGRRRYCPRGNHTEEKRKEKKVFNFLCSSSNLRFSQSA